MDTAARASTFKPALVLMSGRVLGFVATFFIPVVLARVFDQTEFATYKQLFLVYSTLYLIGQLGMAESLYYFLPSARRDAAQYVVNSTLVLSAAGVTCLGFLSISGPAVARWLNNGALAGYVPLLGVYLLLTIVSPVLEIVMVARNRYLWAAASYAASDVLRAVLMIVPVLMTRRLDALLLGAVAFASLRLCGQAFYIRREFRGGLRPDAGLLREQLAYALPFGLGVPFGIFQSYFHQYAVSHYFDAATFAVYAVGSSQVPLVDFIALSACNVMMVRMKEAMRDGEHEMVRALWHDTTKKLALVILPTVSLLLVVGHGLIVLMFTNAYRASVPIFRIWTAAMLLSVLQTDGVIRVYGRTRFALGLSIAKCLLIVALTGRFLSAFGPAGAGLAAVAVMGVDKAVALAAITSFMQVGVSRLLPWRSLATICAAAALAALPALAAAAAAGTATLPGLAGTGAVYASAYVCLLVGAGLLGGQDGVAATGWLQRTVGTMSERSPRPPSPDGSVTGGGSHRPPVPPRGREEEAQAVVPWT